MKKSFWWGIGFIILIAFIWYFMSKPSPYNEFAQCLTDSGTKMYGAYWCPHCQAQKKLFGSSWDKVDYVECAIPNSNEQSTECIIAGVKSYPTWIFADGKSISGELSLQQLSSFTSCPLPAE
ncbi:hypothetical protein J4416_03135 [Candidatus Pacearchaeota archaeon]|nr:hypothetical protein [Candidatus Pacearchaeota archaeon]